MLPSADSLADAVARRFAPAGRFTRDFAREKLRRDPLYFSLLRDGRVPSCERFLDLGCGQGILLALLAEAHVWAARGEWPDGWAPAPRIASLRGIERDPAEVRRARGALGGGAVVEQGDLCDAKLPESDVIALVDVIHYLEPRAQERLLENVAEALAPGGLFLLRVCDAGAGWRALLTRAGDHFSVLVKLFRVARIHLRPAAEWAARLEALGLAVEGAPMSAGTPFANVLLSARRRGAA